jgi:hypothetical protein
MDERRTPPTSRTNSQKKKSPPRGGRSKKASTPTSPGKTNAKTSSTPAQKQASPAKLVVVVTLALGLIGYHNLPEFEISSFSSFVFSRFASLSSQLLLGPATSSESVNDASTSASGFLDLPHTYALCSHPGDGKKIYTVDVNNRIVECVGISGERVVDAGDLGMCFYIRLCSYLSRSPASVSPGSMTRGLDDSGA